MIVDILTQVLLQPVACLPLPPQWSCKQSIRSPGPPELATCNNQFTGSGATGLDRFCCLLPQLPWCGFRVQVTIKPFIIPRSIRVGCKEGAPVAGRRHNGRVKYRNDREWCEWRVLGVLRCRPSKLKGTDEVSWLSAVGDALTALRTSHWPG